MFWLTLSFTYWIHTSLAIDADPGLGGKSQYTVLNDLLHIFAHTEYMLFCIPFSISPFLGCIFSQLKEV